TVVLGNIHIEAVHTPGHTPEHMSFLITDRAQSPKPGFLLTGDFVFVGDLGRPDLLDEAAGGIDTRFGGAKELFRSLKEKFLPLPDYVQVLPAHGSGSACGKALGAVPSSTVGYERHFAWWAKYLKNDDEQGFIDDLLSGQPDAHAYFGRMKVEDRLGPTVIGEVGELKEYAAPELAAALEADEIVFIDTRGIDEVHEGTPAGALNIPGVQKAATYGAWVYNPQVETRPIVLLAQDAEDAAQFREHLVRVGVDAVAGFITSLDGLELTTPKVVTVAELPEFDHTLVLDMRNKTEYSEGHLPGAAQLSAGRALWHTDTLPREGT